MRLANTLMAVATAVLLIQAAVCVGLMRQPAGSEAIAPNSTLYSTATPPARYMVERTTKVVTVKADLISDLCAKHVGEPRPGRAWAGCAVGGTVYVPNPCGSVDETFAQLLCHELGHANGWPRTHGD